MTNRERLIAVLDERASPLLREEIAYTMQVWADDPDTVSEDRADAFLSVMDIAEDNGERKLVRECVDILIAAGYYTPRDPRAEVRFFGGRDRSPVRNGVRYDDGGGLAYWVDAVCQ